jgi:hypothetical protein
MIHRHFKPRRRQTGNATVETIVAMLALAPFFVGIPLLGKQLDIKHKSYDATRYAVWERTVYRSDGVKSAADIEIEARDRTLGNARAGLSRATNLRQAGVTENVLWRDRAGQRLLAAANGNGPKPIAFNNAARESPVEVGSTGVTNGVLVPQIAYGGGVANAAMAVVGVESLGFNRRSFTTAGASVRVRPVLAELANRPFSLRRRTTQGPNQQPLVQASRGGILSDTWSPGSEDAMRTSIDDLVANERMWQAEFPGMALGLLGAKGSPLYGEGQYGFGRKGILGYDPVNGGPDFRVPSTTLPGGYVGSSRQP